ncbi:hypothetical protein [Cupriavidus gilardii]|uniref:hypothetical protein n=1 Tax=Cupriavidus gilardii TaxID=82541 RepID=UPI0021B261F7|nr:hypothetical protein [Cupriavidus gilardii]UXC37156.1 hypothetical protein N4G38_06840 [Cupriavidus gilardii]
MTTDEAVKRQAEHECMQRELVEALKWNASALQLTVNENRPLRERDLMTRTDIGRSMTAGQILDLAESVLARAKEQQK